jgi:hypothetical protein
MTKWNCVKCGYVTTNNMIIWGICPSCWAEDSFLIIPKNMNNILFKAVIAVVDEYYDLETILNCDESGIELWDMDYNRIRTIKTWEDFKYFFGMYFYRIFKEVE